MSFFRVRIGLLWQILIPSVIAASMCIGAVQYWTLNVSQSALQERMNQSLDISLSLLRAQLLPLGTKWTASGGKLALGSTELAGRDDLVDLVATETKGVVTIFSGDERILTTVKNPDGSRAKGTRLTDPKVREAVLKDGKSYKGQSVIVGRRYLTSYEPIRDASQAVVGILFVGLPVAELEAVQADVLRQGVLAGGAAMAVLALGLYLLMTRALRPFDNLAAATIDVAKGNLDQTIPSLQRGDEVGRMANAVNSFKAAALDKLRLEAEAEARRAHDAAEASAQAKIKERAAQDQAQAMSSLAVALETLSQGDLTFRMNGRVAADYKKIQSDFNSAVSALSETMSQITRNSGEIKSGSAEVAIASDDLSRGTEQQAASLEQTAAALAHVADSVQKTAASAKDAKGLASVTRDKACEGGEVVKRAIGAMSKIAQSSRQISQIIGVIDEIAFQTNLLALNAGVEAARAGEAGRGFAVVASEVRALAQRSAEAAKEIKSLIAVATSEVAEGVALVDQTGTSLQEIVSQVATIDLAIQRIAEAATDQANGLSEVNVAVSEMDRTTQQNAAMVEESTAASHTLSREAETLATLLRQFKVEDAQQTMRRRVA